VNDNEVEDVDDNEVADANCWKDVEVLDDFVLLSLVSSLSSFCKLLRSVRSTIISSMTSSVILMSVKALFNVCVIQVIAWKMPIMRLGVHGLLEGPDPIEAANAYETSQLDRA
jgi:hypothetical protein